MLVKDLIKCLQSQDQDIPVYYIDDGDYIEVQKLGLTALCLTKWNFISTTKTYSKHKDNFIGEPFKAVVLDSDFFNKIQDEGT